MVLYVHSYIRVQSQGWGFVAGLLATFGTRPKPGPTLKAICGTCAACCAAAGCVPAPCGSFWDPGPEIAEIEVCLASRILRPLTNWNLVNKWSLIVRLQPCARTVMCQCPLTICRFLSVESASTGLAKRSTVGQHSVL